MFFPPVVARTIPSLESLMVRRALNAPVKGAWSHPWLLGDIRHETMHLTLIILRLLPGGLDKIDVDGVNSMSSPGRPRGVKPADNAVQVDDSWAFF